MTIKRQYILPNCSLILEGLSADASNVLSILANAEFKIVGVEQSLSGGTEFFKALAVAVSAYCQRLISGLDHPEHMASQVSLVAVEPDEGQYHRLIVKPEFLNDSSGEGTATTSDQTIKLSTVQLFDMAEAIDQFYADTQTLPDVSVHLAPLPRKYVRPEEPLAKRAISPLLGAGTLAVAALGLFFLPVPELAEPEGLDPQGNSADVLENQAESGLTTDPPDPTATSEVTAADDGEQSDETATPVRTTITDPTQLVALQQQVQQQFSDRLPSDTAFEQSLRYQISVAENGDIVGYNPLDTVSLESLDDTPLPELTYIPVDEAAVGPVAQFDVTFAPDGTVEVGADQVVTPDSETVTPEVVTPEGLELNSAEEEALEEILEEEVLEEGVLDNEQSDAPLDTPSPQSSTPAGVSESNSQATAASGELPAFIATPIQEVDRIYELNQGLRRTIISNRDSDHSGPELRYRVRLDQSGNVTGYEASNSAAEQYIDDFQLPSLVEAATDDQPQLDFLVVVSDDNVVEVNPWDGWP